MEKITVTIATQARRRRSLADTVASLKANTIKPDVIDVYANDYGLPKRRDLADNGKFHNAGYMEGYHLTCDDDLLYPKDYIEKTIAGIEKYGRKAVVGYHGVTLKPTPIKTYYFDRLIFKCLKELQSDMPVHILGTGALGYHASVMKLSISDFKTPYMADIYFGVAAQKQSVPMICLAHDADWIKQTRYANSFVATSIYAKHRNNHSIQTAVCNELNWQINKIALPLEKP